MTDLSGYGKKSTANGDTRSSLRLRLRIAVPGRAADADPPQHLTCGKFNNPKRTEFTPVPAAIDDALAADPNEWDGERGAHESDWVTSGLVNEPGRNLCS